jgi:hypothetical protein
MRALLARLAALAALCLGSCAALFALLPPSPNDYRAAGIDKRRALAAAPSPKIVLVGGSNLAFGVDSRALGGELGYRVVNMGLHANLGLRFMLAEAGPFVRSGDVVVVSPEYEHFCGFSGSGTELPAAVRLSPGLLDGVVHPRQYGALLRFFPAHLRTQIAVRLAPGAGESLYRRDAFDERGDMVAHLRLPGSPGKVSRERLFADCGPGLDEGAFAALERFRAHAERRGARVVFDYPAIPAPHFQASSAWIGRIHGELRRRGSVPLLSGPRETVLPISGFLDTPYHLTEAGRRVRTRGMVERLRTALPRR